MEEGACKGEEMAGMKSRKLKEGGKRVSPTRLTQCHLMCSETFSPCRKGEGANDKKIDRKK